MNEFKIGVLRRESHVIVDTVKVMAENIEDAVNKVHSLFKPESSAQTDKISLKRICPIEEVGVTNPITFIEEETISKFSSDNGLISYYEIKGDKFNRDNDLLITSNHLPVETYSETHKLACPKCGHGNMTYDMGVTGVEYGRLTLNYNDLVNFEPTENPSLDFHDPNITCVECGHTTYNVADFVNSK